MIHLPRCPRVAPGILIANRAIWGPVCLVLGKNAKLQVELSQKNLGIVAAAREGRPVVSRASDLPEDSGSGRWLRAFGASRSVAEPIRSRDGRVDGVLSVALPPEITLEDQEVVKRVQRAAFDQEGRSVVHGPASAGS